MRKAGAAGAIVMVGVIGLVLAASPSAALAAPARKAVKPAAGKDSAEAKAHFQKAEKAFNMGKFEEALAGYEAAYEAKPLPAFLFNIAQCHRNLGNAERALFFYQRYLSLDTDPPHRKVVEELIAEMQKVLAAQEAGAARRAAPATPPTAPLPTAGPGAESMPPMVGAPATGAKPIHHRWWFWGAVGVVLTGAALAIFITRDGPLPTGKLGAIDAR